MQTRDPDPRQLPSGRLVNRSATLARHRASLQLRSSGDQADPSASRASTIADWSCSASAPPEQVDAFDGAIADLHDAVAVGNHHVWGDPLPPHLQLKRAQGHAAPDAHAIAARGLAGAAAPLPHLDTIQASFGHHDVSGVRAQIGGPAREASAALAAHGYTMGDEIGFASAPDLHLAAHEAAHVVQQRAGVSLEGGVGQASDVYERHADAVADLVVSGQRAEALLDRMAGGRASAGETVQRKALQLHPGDAPSRLVHDPHAMRTRLIELLRAREEDQAAELREADDNTREHRQRVLDETRQRLAEARAARPRSATEVEALARRANIPVASVQRDALSSAGRTSVEHDGVRSREHSDGDGARNTVRRTTTGGPSTERRLPFGAERLVPASMRERTDTVERTDDDGVVRSSSVSAPRTSLGAMGAAGLTRQGRRVTTSEREADADGRPGQGAGTTRTVDEGARHAGLDAEGARFGRAAPSRTDTSHRDDGSSVEVGRRGSDETRVALDAEGRVSGVSRERSRSRTDTTRDANGQETERRSSTVTTRGGVVDGANGRGVTGSISGSTSDQNRTEGASVNGSANGTLTSRQVGAGGTAGGGYNRGPMRFEQSFGASSSYTVNVEPKPDEGPDQFDLVTTLRYEVSAGGGLGARSGSFGANSGNGAGVTGSARLRRERTFRHRMTSAQVEQYRRALRAATESGQVDRDGKPEVGLVARLQLAHQQGRTPSDAELADSRAFGRGLAQGSQIRSEQETQTTVGLNGQVEGAVGSVGASATGTRSQRVVRQVERRRIGGRDVYRVRLTFEGTTAGSVSHNGAVGVGALNVGARTQVEGSHRSGRTIEVDLDPNAADFERRRAEVMAVSSAAEAEAIAARSQVAITRTSESSRTTSGGVGFMDDGNVRHGVTATERRQTGAEVTVSAAGADGRRTVSGTTTGESESRMGVNIAGTGVLRAGSQTTATNNVSEQGEQEVSITRTRTSGVETPEWARGLANRGQRFGGLEQLRALMRGTEQEIQRYQLSGSDLDALVGRARDGGRWLNALAGRELLHVRGPWMVLRQQLTNPRPEAEWVAANAELANRLARGRALTAFIGGVGPEHGCAAVHAILRNADPRRPLGVLWEWPDALREEQRTWASLHAEVEGLGGRFAGIRAADRVARIQRESRRIQNGLEAIKEAISTCRTFREPAAKVEMLGAIDRDQRAVREAEREATRTPAPASEGAQPRTTDADAARAPAEATHEATTPEVTARRGRERELEVARATARRYKQAERELWGRAQAAIARGADRTLSSARGDVREAVDALQSIETMWIGAWGAAWRDYRRLGAELGVQVDPGLRTNTSWRAALLRQAVALDAARAGWWNADAIIARWERQDEDR